MGEQKKQEISPWPWSWALSRNVTGHPKNLNADDGDDVFCILDRDGFIASEIVSHWEQSVAEHDISIMASAPELRAALEVIVRNACRMCESELKVSMHGAKKPCEDGRPCPRGMDDAKKAIAKSYWKKDKENG